jgi:hypothetical protein
MSPLRFSTSAGTGAGPGRHSLQRNMVGSIGNLGRRSASGSLLAPRLRSRGKRYPTRIVLLAFRWSRKRTSGAPGRFPAHSSSSSSRLLWRAALLKPRLQWSSRVFQRTPSAELIDFCALGNGNEWNSGHFLLPRKPMTTMRRNKSFWGRCCRISPACDTKCSRQS